LITFYDITSIHCREQEFKALAENAPDIVARLDTRQRYLYVNKTIERITERKRSEFIGKTKHDLGMSADWSRIWEQEIKQVLLTAKERTFQFEFPTFDGPKTFEARVVPEFSPDGRISSLLVISRDIISHKLAERKLTELNNRLQGILDNIPVFITLYDAEANLQFVNKAFETTCGWTQDEVESTDILQTCFPDPGFRSLVVDHMQQARSSWKQFSLTTRNRTSLETLWSSARLEDGTLIGIGMDVSGKKNGVTVK
jgi:PAS domain S-box-containing protein